MSNPITNDPIIQQRFWSKVDISDPDDCWAWTASTTSDGYGCIRINCRLHNSHRVAWELENGPIPNGIHILHHCDNPACCNPSHLLLGTHSDNMKDMANKGRAGNRGSRNKIARLTEQDILTIREMVNGGTKQKDIAKEYSVHVMTISDIIRGATWTHVP